MTVTETTFQQIALEDPSGHWELHCGQLRQKPSMTAEHNETMSLLHIWLGQQVDPEEFRVRSNSGHVRRSAENYFIPDVSVIPTQLFRPQLGTRKLEVYRAPLPLVVEIW